MHLKLKARVTYLKKKIGTKVTYHNKNNYKEEEKGERRKKKGERKE